MASAPSSEGNALAPTRSAAPREVPFPREQSNFLYSLTHYKGNPLARFEDMRRRYPPVAGFRMLDREIVIVHDPAVVEEILVRQHTKFIKDTFTAELGTVLGRGLLTSQGEHHKRQRKLIAPSLAAPEVAHHATSIHENACRATAKLQPGQRLDLQRFCMHLTLDVLTQTLFGQTFDECELVDREMKAVMAAFRPWPQLFRTVCPTWVPLPSRRHIETARDRLHGVVDRLIASKRRGTLGDDLLSRLLLLKDEQGSLTEDELRDQVITFLLAGHETTALALVFTLRLLGEHPRWRDRVEAEVDAVSARGVSADSLRDMHQTYAVLQEALRLYPPAWMMGRQPIEDCVIAGWQLRKGQQLIIPVFTIQRDPRWYSAPDRFDPSRFLADDAADARRPGRFTYLPFGSGPRVCVGSHFATLEALAILCALLRRVRLVGASNAPFEVATSITLRPASAVPMRVVMR